MPATAKPPPQTKKRTRSTRKTREAEAVKEYENLIDTSTQEALLAAQTDDDLFVVDRGGSKNKKRKIQKAEISKKESGTISKTETILINRIKKNKNTNEAIVVKEKGKKEDNVFDLWGGDEVTKQPRATTRKSFKKIAGPGLSYNPAHEDHQEALAEAVALDMKHQEEIVRKDKAFDMTAYHNSIASQNHREHSDDDESSSEDDASTDEEEGTGGPRTLSRRERARKDNVKLTRAQRNKMRTKRITGYEKTLVDRQKALEKGLNALPKHLKSVEEEEAQRQAQKEFRETQKEAALEAEEAALTAMTYEDAGTVPLTDELQGSLRLMQPKGVSLADQTALMTASGDLANRNRRNRKKSEKPHSGKKVKWIPKYKHF